MFGLRKDSIREYFEIFTNDFYENDNHRWIVQDRYIKANFDEFFEKLPRKIIKRLVKGPILLFLPSSGRFSCTLTNMNAHIVVVFPELMQLLKSPATNHALAILSHEVGHIVYEHSKKKIEPTEAQVQADFFACQLGFASEIESFLHDQPESIEKRVRLSYVTSYIISRELTA